MKKALKTAALLIFQHLLFAQNPPAFPGAEGFGAVATGGRGGKVVYVTNLNCSGAGSLNEALAQPGKKYILFKVSGIIPCAAEILEGEATIAGQTSPGGIIVRGIIADDFYTAGAHPDNLIVRHLRSRGAATHSPAGTTTDPLIVSGVKNSIFDHCSFSNSLDEAVDISRSTNLTIQNCLLAETLGDHADLGGMLINYSSPGQVMDNLSIHHNCWNRLGGRMPEFSCEDPTGCVGHTVHAELSNNLFWDQQIQTWFNADANLGLDDTQPFFLHLNVENNYSVARQNYGGPMFAFDFLANQGNKLFARGNRMNLYPNLSDYQLFYCCNDFNEPANHPNTDAGMAQHLASRHDFPPVSLLAATDLPSFMLKNVGAFPRFPHEKRLMAAVETGQIASPAVNLAAADDVLTLPFATSPAAPLDSDSDGMPDTWELAKGLNPNVQDHNGTQLSQAITGVAGYTNLECYLNCLAEARVFGSSSAVCGITTGTDSAILPNSVWSVFPNPLVDQVSVRFFDEHFLGKTLRLSDSLGRPVFEKTADREQVLDLQRLPAGVYFLKMEGLAAMCLLKN